MKDGEQMTPIERMVEADRSLLQRLEPREADAAVRRGGVIVDIRSHEQRVEHGVVPGSVRVHRNVLEWRVDPSSGWHDDRFAAYDGPVIVMCQEGYSSSMAAATLQRLGFTRATDMVGGFEAWAEAGLPTQPLDPTVDPAP
jgi:rhodanese-related sulfurtransferase